MDVELPETDEYVAIGAARQAAWVLSGEAEPPAWPVKVETTLTGEPTPAGVRAVRALARLMTSHDEVVGTTRASSLIAYHHQERNIDDFSFHSRDDKQIRVIIDTDADCEADDPFAIAQALLTPKFMVKAICASISTKRAVWNAASAPHPRLFNC